MEVCYHRVYDLKFISRLNKKLCRTGHCAHFAVLSYRFECSHRRGSHRDNLAAGDFCFVDYLCVFGIENKLLAVYLVVLKILGGYRFECSGSDVQRQVCEFYAAKFQLFYQRFGKVQTCGRSSDCASLFGIDGLVSFDIHLGVVASVGSYFTQCRRKKGYSKSGSLYFPPFSPM